MEGLCLTFFVSENRKLHGLAIYEWLLEQGRALGLKGGSAVRAMAGFGRHGRLHEDHFFELGGELPVEVSFIASAEEAERLLARVSAEKLGVFHTVTAVKFGVTD